MNGNIFNKIKTDACKIFKQLREDDQPYLKSLYREKSFTHHIKEFMDSEDEEKEITSFPF